MSAQARVIDLETYRRRREQQQSRSEAQQFPAMAMMAQAAWIPVLVWVPVWPVL